MALFGSDKSIKKAYLECGAIALAPSLIMASFGYAMDNPPQFNEEKKERRGLAILAGTIGSPFLLISIPIGIVCATFLTANIVFDTLIDSVSEAPKSMSEETAPPSIQGSTNRILESLPPSMHASNSITQPPIDRIYTKILFSANNSPEPEASDYQSLQYH